MLHQIMRLRRFLGNIVLNLGIYYELDVCKRSEKHKKTLIEFSLTTGLCLRTFQPYD